jgi:branched-chain amino acid transport system ATP-binding protein
VSFDALLQVDAVGKQFGGLTVLNDVNFSIVPGEIVGLVGPNGSGKTTLINVISGVHRVDSGQILLDGDPVQRLSSFRLARRGINRTFQIPKPFRSMTVHENIAVAAHFCGHDQVDIAAILNETSLSGQADMPAGVLTVNQQKMLDLGRALATNPKILLIDEIGAGLNPQELAVIATLLQRLAARGIAMIVVEHLLDFLNRIAERVIVLGAGRMLFEGTLRAASQDPEVVAAFIGG